jgi:cell division protein FtsA
MHAPVSNRTNKTNITIMKDQQPIIAAIDIGTTKIVCLVGRKNESGKIDILALSKAPSTGVKRGVVLNIEETVKAMKKTVEEVKQRSGVIFDEVYVGIAGQHIRTIQSRDYINRESDDEEITKHDIERLIRGMGRIPVDPGEEIIHVLPQNFIVDNETGVKNPVGMSGRRLEANFHIVIGKVASAKNIEKCVNRVGLNVKDLVLEPLASSTAVLTNDEMEAGVALVDIGGGTTDIAVYYDNVIRHTAVIPFGGNVVTNDIKEGCSILLKQAEVLKTTYGSAMGDMAPSDHVVTIPGIAGREPKEISFKFLAHIIQARMDEILGEVSYQIESSGVAKKLSAGIVLTGGGAMLKHLPQLVRFRTGFDVRIGYPNQRLGGELADEINQPMYSTAVGLILEGFKQEKENRKPRTKKVFDKDPQGEKTEGEEKEAKGNESGKDEENEPRLFGRIRTILAGLFEEGGMGMDEE